MRWVGHVAYMHIQLWWESQKEKDHHEDLDVGAKIILTWW
jgi:hypothetical protein